MAALATASPRTTWPSTTATASRSARRISAWADLQTVLSLEVGGEGLHLGYRLTALEEEGTGLRLHFASGRTDSRSRRRRRRRALAGPRLRRRFHSRCRSGARGAPLLGHQRLPRHRPNLVASKLAGPAGIQFWMGPDAHLLHYAIGGQAHDVNFFAVIEGPERWERSDRWRVETEPGECGAWTMTDFC